MATVGETEQQHIQELLTAHRSFFASHKTRDVAFRIEQLKKLRKLIKTNEQAIAEALKKDLNKSFEEAYLTEISIVLQEIDQHLKHIRRWAEPERVHTPFYLLPSSSYILHEPLGVALIMAPWNYPFQLVINPLVGAISSGCCAMLKPSPATPHVAQLVERLIGEYFDPAYISVVQGSKPTNELLFQERFDLIFFTGSPMMGRVVMRAAAEFLTPVILELGGKSPCIVDAGADIKVAAKRIAFGKTINAGQTCIAPDYLLVHKDVKEPLIQAIGEAIESMFGPDIRNSDYYPRMVSEEAVVRVAKLMEHGRIRYGGQVDRAARFIQPTLIDEVEHNFPIMQEEIFGPVLPILTYNTLDEAIDFVNRNEKPLALYYFGKAMTGKKVFAQTSSGGGCINDTLMHIANHHMPFGGVGNSGYGQYHGHHSFLAFSNTRPVVHTPTWFDLPVKYVPFKFFNWVKRIL
jgi:aldehyde dehydrogenase (NAD+)